MKLDDATTSDGNEGVEVFIFVARGYNKFLSCDIGGALFRGGELHLWFGDE